MPAQRLNVASMFPVVAQFVATGETDCRIVNWNQFTEVRWLVTGAATPPTLSEHEGSPIAPDTHADFTLKDGEHLWVAAPDIGADSFNVTLMT